MKIKKRLDTTKVPAQMCQSKRSVWTTHRAMLSHIPVHDTKHLFANVLCPLQRSDLHKVFVAPSARELVVAPRVVDSKQRQVVAFGLVKFGLLLIGKGLLVLDDNQQKGTTVL